VTVPPSAVDDRLRKDATLIQLEGELTKAKARLAATERLYKPGVTAPAITKARDEVQAADEDLTRARADLRPRVEAALREELTEERQRKAAHDAETLDRLTRRKAALAARVEEIRGKLADANRARIDLENLKQETAHADKFAGTVADEAERLRLELGAPPRVTVSEEPFVAAGLEGNRRLKITLAGMLAVFVAGFGLLVLYEYRTRPVTRARDAADGLGLRLLGTVPALGARAGRYNSDPHRALAEAIDTTRTMVLYGAADRRVRSLLVTSAVDGEGKTSLAGHLAISLARAGFRTLLVDGDVQAPSAHALFDLPAAPGLCEVLRGEATADQAVRQTGLPGLSVLPAGAWDLIARQALVGHRWKAVKVDLEAGYDFVVIDSGPILLVSDSLLLARDADGVLLSVLIDVSRVASVEETRDRLRTVGANVLGVVVNGVVTPSYRSVQARGPAAPARLAETGLPA
jgi:capsular exopolysaccharide synthesis family protein